MDRGYIGTPADGFFSRIRRVPSRILELLKVVLGHETEELLDLLDFGTCYRRAFACFRGLFAFHAFVKAR